MNFKMFTLSHIPGYILDSETWELQSVCFIFFQFSFFIFLNLTIYFGYFYFLNLTTSIVLYDYFYCCYLTNNIILYDYFMFGIWL